MTVGLKSRALAVRLVVLSLVAMGWFAFVRLAADGGGNSEVVVA